MFYSSPSLEKLIGELSKLPGIGRKSAQRLAFFILKQTNGESEKLANAILDLKNNTSY